MSLRRRSAVSLAARVLTTAALAGVTLAAPVPAALAAPAPAPAPAAGTEGAAASAPTPTAAARAACPASYERIACVDLTTQAMWFQESGRTTFGPVPVRTGRAGYATRTGLWHIYQRNVDQWSTLYDVSMPFSQFFDGGIAFHGISGSVYSPPGSHGCINLSKENASALWGILRTGDPVVVTGHKPGT